MPIRLLVHDLPNALLPDLTAYGVSVVVTSPPHGDAAPWAIFQLMERHNVFPAKSVLRLARSSHGIREALNSGAWAVGVVDISEELNLTATVFAALTEVERESHRDRVREVYLKAGADAVIDGLHELPEAIEALNQLGRDDG